MARIVHCGRPPRAVAVRLAPGIRPPAYPAGMPTLHRRRGLAASLAVLAALSLAGCSTKDGGDADATTGPTEQTGLTVTDATHSAAYSIDANAISDTNAEGAKTLALTAIVTRADGAPFSPAATVVYDDGTTLECRLPAGAATPTLSSERVQVTLECSDALRFDEPGEITITDDFNR